MLANLQRQQVLMAAFKVNRQQPPIDAPFSAGNFLLKLKFISLLHRRAHTCTHTHTKTHTETVNGMLHERFWLLFRHSVAVKLVVGSDNCIFALLHIAIVLHATVWHNAAIFVTLPLVQLFLYIHFIYIYPQQFRHVSVGVSTLAT